MHSIMIRATDPVAAADTLRAIGIELGGGANRPNPGRWHGSCRIAVSVVACGAGEEPSIALGSATLDRMIARLPADTAVERTGEAAIVDVGGLRLPVVADAGPVRRPGLDCGLLLHAEVIVFDAADELAEALPRLGARNPRLVGPELMLGRFDRVFTLVVDGADDAAIAKLDAILAAHAHPAMRIEARSAASLDAETLARVNRLAWDVHV